VVRPEHVPDVPRLHAALDFPAQFLGYFFDHVVVGDCVVGGVRVRLMVMRALGVGAWEGARTIVVFLGLDFSGASSSSLERTDEV
jgi:hypothetical protein